MTYLPPRQAVQLAPPAIEPVSLAEAKLYLRIDSTSEDSLITSLIGAARERAEQWLGQLLISQSWQMSQIYVPGQAITLAPGPVIGVTKVSIVALNTTSILASEAYSLDVTAEKVTLLGAPAADKVIIEYTAGFGDAVSHVPAPIKQGMLQLISQFYHCREESGAIDAAIKTLWNPYRKLYL